MKPKCIKCGSEDIYTCYQELITDEWNPGCKLKNIEEHLHRNCRNCQYEWCDETLDQSSHGEGK